MFYRVARIFATSVCVLEFDPKNGVASGVNWNRYRAMKVRVNCKAPILAKENSKSSTDGAEAERS